MAIQDLSLLVLAQNYAGNIKRQINRRSVLLALLRKVKGEGKNVAWAAEGDGALAESYAEGADVAAYGSDSQKQAVLSWGQYRAPFAVSGLALAAAATSRTPEGNVELWARNMENSATKLASLLNADLFVGTGANKLIGLDDAIGDDVNTYATIDRTVDTYWKPYLVGNGGVPQAITFEQIRTDLAAIYKSSGFHPNIAVVNPDVHTKIASLFDPVRQYQFDVREIPDFQGDMFALQGGAGAILFDGCYFVQDKDAPTGKIYYLNTDVVEIEYQDLFTAAAQVAMANNPQMVELMDGFEGMMLGVIAEALAKTGDADKAVLRGYLQLAVRRPNACGVREDITV